MVISEGMLPRTEAAVQLKECPVCHAQCFSDMDVCYGCLNTFKPGATEDAFDESVPALLLGDGYGQVQHIPQNLSAHEIDRAVAREEVRTAQTVPGAKSVLVTPVARVGRDGLDKSSGEDISNKATCSAISDPKHNQMIGASEEGEHKRIAAPMRLTDLLEIVISVRIAQDAKARCENRQNRVSAGEPLD